MKFGVIGYGYWGPNIVRNLTNLEDSQVAGNCGDQPRMLDKRAQKAHPGIKITSRTANEVVTSPEIDAVAVITPVWTHYRIGEGALRKRQARVCGEAVHQHVRARRGTDRSCAQKNLTIMVDHTFLFTGAVKKIWQLLDEGALGQALLLRFHARESRPVPARHQRALGSCAARSFDHGLPDQGRVRKRWSRPGRGT